MGGVEAPAEDVGGACLVVAEQLVDHYGHECEGDRSEALDGVIPAAKRFATGES